MNIDLLGFVPDVLVTRQEALSLRQHSFSQYPHTEWDRCWTQEHELVKETPKTEIFLSKMHWFAKNKTTGEVKYVYTDSNETSGKKFLAIGGPLTGHMLSRFRIGDDYVPFNNAGTSAHSMIWVYKPLLNN